MLLRSSMLLLWVLAPASVFAQANADARYKGLDTTSIASVSSIMGNRVACEDGVADAFPCKEVDMLSFLSIGDLVGDLPIFASRTNDIWGWTDPITQTEYALVGLNSGVSFVDLSDPVNPQTIGYLVTKTGSSVWRDIKVYRDHAFIVADAAANHGMQILDLSQLRDVENPPVQFQETAHYDQFGSAHNIVINERTGFAYAVGANSSGETCGGGLHMIDIRNPVEPSFVGCYADVTTGNRGTGYTHDAQCVVYTGPDEDYRGREICIGSNETALSVADVTDKANPVRVAAVSYPNVSYSHQGWFSEDQRYFFMDDETDEIFGLPNTRTIIWDMEDLDDPLVATEYMAESPATDHNQYVVGSGLYQSNYTSGLRILDIRDPLAPEEVGFFDMLPDDERTHTGTGTWSNYPFFESGVVVATSILEGLYVLQPTGTSAEVATEREQPVHARLNAPYPNPFSEITQMTLDVDQAGPVRVEVFDILGRQVAVLLDEVLPAGSSRTVTFDGRQLSAGEYFIQTRGTNVFETVPVTLVR